MSHSYLFYVYELYELLLVVAFDEEGGMSLAFLDACCSCLHSPGQL